MKLSVSAHTGPTRIPEVGEKPEFRVITVQPTDPSPFYGTFKGLEWVKMPGTVVERQMPPETIQKG